MLVGSFVFMGCQPTNSIPYGEACLCGRYSEEIYVGLQASSAMVQLVVLTFFAEGYVKKEIQLNDDGTFTIDIPVVFNTWCQIGLEGYHIGVFLLPGQKTEFEMTMGVSRKRNLKMIEGVGWTEEDSKEEEVQVSEISKTLTPNWSFPESISTETYQQHVINNLNEIRKEVENNTQILYNRKQILINRYKMAYLYWCVLNSDENPYGGPQPLTKASDFTFLKYFKLNDLSEFYTSGYMLVLHKILEMEVFQIPLIGDTSVEIWLKEVKAILADLIGSDTGFFYDLLAANAYCLQLKNGSKPFSNRQIENIKAYFPNETYIDVLMAENEKTIGLNRSNNLE